MGLSWQVKYSDLVIVLVLIITSSGEPLTGENVCQRMENYTATWKESYEEYVPVYTTTWCMSIPPKCMRTYQELRIRYRTKTGIRQKNITECCDGYAPQKLTIDNENNYVINCVAISQCKAGFIGKNCDAVCPQGTWGRNCQEACNCNNQMCNPINGLCQCPPGWIGNNCTDKCKIGKWGSDCKSNCSCSNENNTCHHVTGNCIKIIKSIDKLSGILNNKLLNVSTSTISTLLNGTINDDDDSINKFNSDTINLKNNSDNEVNVTTEISQNSNLATTIINKFHEHTTNQDIRVIKINKSTTKPILAVVHVSGKTFTEHDKMIITPEVQTVPLSLEIVAIIIIGCMMSLGLMIMIVLALLHIRTKLFETIRLSIYDTGKLDNHETTLTRQKFNDEIKFQSIKHNNRISCQSSDYETPRCIVPDRPLTLPRPISTMSTPTRESTYSNQFPNIQLFNSPRELLEAHYDRPPATNTFRQITFPVHDEGEHLYDEIPLRSTIFKKYHDTINKI